MEKEILKVSLFNEVIFEYQDQRYLLSKYLTKQLLSLMEVLILSFGTQVTSESLMNVLWEGSNNPKSSLKYHIFKLRKYLKDIPGFEDVTFIETSRAGYEFKPNIICEIDTFTLHNNYLTIQNVKALDSKNLVYALIIEKAYSGYLKFDANNLWFLQAKEYYHNIYLKTVDKLCSYLLENHENEMVKEISLKAVKLDPMIETHHIYYIQALINLNEFEKGYDYYQEATKMLLADFDISLSDRMREIYDYLIDGVKQRNIVTIAGHFKNKKSKEGAFYCESIIFDYIYDMHLRSAKRTKLNYYLFVFEFVPKSEIKNLTQKIKHIIQYSLRNGDVFTRVSRYQFVALLPCENDEIGHTVAQRVTSVIRKKLNTDYISVRYYIDNVISGDGEVA